MILESLFIYSFNKAKQSRTREELNTDTEDEDQEEAGTSNIIQPGGQLPSKEKLRYITFEQYQGLTDQFESFKSSLNKEIRGIKTSRPVETFFYNGKLIKFIEIFFF